MQQIDLSLFRPYDTVYQTGVRLGDYAYSLCGGPCDGFFMINGSKMLKDIVSDCISAKVPYKVLGGMSNILISDTGFTGIILMNRQGAITHKETENGSVLLEADSGASMASVVRYCRENELSGFEWAAGLPGTVGGAVYGNAGAFGTEIKDIFQSGEIIDEACRDLSITNTDMDFSYRCSALKNKSLSCVLLRAEFSLEKGSREDISSKEGVCREKRQASQPISERSLGSVFKNPVGHSAGKLIQDAGLKGMTVGKAVVSTKHANFITTSEGIQSSDYRKLMILVQMTVFEKFGINLEPEIELLGFEER